MGRTKREGAEDFIWEFLYNIQKNMPKIVQLYEITLKQTKTEKNS
jgi:hypothetical protein